MTLLDANALKFLTRHDVPPKSLRAQDESVLAIKGGLAGQSHQNLSTAIEGDFTASSSPTFCRATLPAPRSPARRRHCGTARTIFHNLVLADEINRAPAKVQSALLEAMAEHQVSVGRQTFKLPELFLVMATQNPIRTGRYISAT